MVSRHIHRNATRSSQFGQTTLGSRGTTDILQSYDNLEHGSETSLAEANAKTLMRPESKVGVCIHITVKLDLFGLFEGGRVLAGRNLGT